MTDEKTAAVAPVDPSVEPDYPTKCLGCGGDLLVVAFADPQTAPWGCHPCGRGYWPAELRAAMEHGTTFDPTHGWASGTRSHEILEACHRDQQVAEIHGTSLLVEQLHLVDDDVLTFWRDHRVTTAAFRSEIDAHLTFRHYKPPKPKPKKAAAKTRKTTTPREG